MMKRLLLLCCLVFPSLPAFAASGLDMEAAFKQGQAAYAENRLDDAAQSFLQAAEGLAAMKQAEKARAVYGNAAVIRIRQERWQDALDIYAKALALPGKAAPEALVKMTRNIVVCAEKLDRPLVKAEAIARMLAAKPALSPEDSINFLAMQGDAYRAAELYFPACAAYEQALAGKGLQAGRRLALLTGLGLAQGNLGQYAKALASLEKARGEAEALREPLPLAESISNMGILYWEMGEYDKAATALRQALDREKEFRLRRNEGVDNNNMGLVYKNAGKLNEAMTYVDTALDIAREVRNRRDEAIALSNRALLLRMNGRLEEALQAYGEALALYREVRFREGEASALMGLARLEMVSGKDYPAALEKLTRASEIYEQLGNPGFLAESYVQLGLLYQKVATPKRKTRDLVFEDSEPVLVEMAPREALARSAEYFAKALPLAQKTGRKEMHWGALHGLAFSARENGDLVRAEDLYAKAVAVVLSMKGAEENPDLLQEFLRDKDDLFAQAIDVCAKLYRQKKDPALLKKQLEYDEIYRNEVLRANMKMASLEYADPQKKALYAEIIQLSASKKKAEAAAAAAAAADGAPAAASPAAARHATLTAREFEARLAQWKKDYAQDAVLFDSMASVDTAQLQALLGPDQAIVQYIPLEDALIILTITKEEVGMTSVAVTYEALASLIRDRLLAENIEDFGHGNIGEAEGFRQGIDLCRELSAYVYDPVLEKLRDKKRLFFITSKYLSYVPFAALVIGTKDNGAPTFLVEEKIISLTRLSFLHQFSAKQKSDVKYDSIISVGNPVHADLSVVLGDLPGAEKEAALAVQAIKSENPDALSEILLKQGATKTALYTALNNKKYSIFYFATHGVPYAEILADSGKIRKSVKRAVEKGQTSLNKTPIERYQAFLDFYDKVFTNNSHLNGFLYFSYPDGNEDGTLKLRDVLELPDSVFANANLAVLSACNTAVSYSPKVLKKKEIHTSLEEEQAAQELVAAGWTPGVDQVCLVDSFMKRNFRNVFGTLWFADDVATAFIMEHFMRNLKTLPPAEALREAQLLYLRQPPPRPADNASDYPQHPFFWACGNIFGQ
ncbi:MAG: CHAT domain-containing protein [Desulfovibrio sp.]|jgi:CHAT domain-containing protein/tetratricopeptide (TPR) repeat protein|nr:CHAT domain-containing protein [Desulfovibrio sp.]